MPPIIADLEAFMPDYSCQAFIEIKLQELGRMFLSNVTLGGYFKIQIT